MTEVDLDPPCPGCGQAVPTTARYPRPYCRACVARAVDVNGDRITLTNANLLGGFVAHVLGTEGPVVSPATETGEVFIDGRRCRAAEHRFGGVVVQPLDEPKDAKATE